MIGGAIAAAIGWVGTLGTRALSRYREFAADAGAVRAHRQPGGARLGADQGLRRARRRSRSATCARPRRPTRSTCCPVARRRRLAAAGHAPAAAGAHRAPRSALERTLAAAANLSGCPTLALVTRCGRASPSSRCRTSTGSRRRLKRARKDDAQGRERLERDIERARAADRAAARGRARGHLPEELPVSARRDDLLAAIRDHQVVIVAGETGSGKTTQLPKICLELGRGVRGAIAHTQPRRLAARTVAERIADELDVPLGEAVGYAVRFNDRSGEDTLLRLMTDGLLLAEIQRDRLLRRYDTIIVDEAHERSLNIDFLLGYLKRILPAAAGPEGDRHVGDDRPGALRRALRRRADRRGLRAHVSRSRSATGRARRGRRPGRRDRRRRRRAAARAARRHPRVPLRRARDPRHRRRAARAGCATASRSCRCTRASPTAEQQRVFKPHAEPPRRARDQRRRDVADRARASATSSTRARRGSAATARG